MKKILLTFFLFAIAGLAYWGCPIVKKRYFTNVETPSENQGKNAAPEQPQNNNQEPAAPESADENVQSQASEEKPVNFLDVAAKDCDENCKQFKADPEELKYCSQICGLEPIRKNITDCDNLEDLEKDYCLKDLAVSKKDFKTCDQIEDANIKKTCVNRVTEEILNSQESI